jgi:hypothetical protein
MSSKTPEEFLRSLYKEQLQKPSKNDFRLQNDDRSRSSFRCSVSGEGEGDEDKEGEGNRPPSGKSSSSYLSLTQRF